MFITPPRKEVVDFSDPIYTYGEGLVVPRSDTKAYATQDDLKGQTVGAQVGTAFVDALKKSGLFADVKAYDTIPDILRDVNTGRLKAGYADYPILAYNLKQGGFPRCGSSTATSPSPSARSASACARARPLCSARSTPRSPS